jgi:hypothetical protein
MSEKSTYDQAQRRLELAVIDFFFEINPSLTRDSKERVVVRTVEAALKRLK